MGTGRNPKVHGEIPGVKVGSKWNSRVECSEAGVHGPLRAGIHGNQTDGAFSVVLSGGYEDDEDRGEIITYTGQGGRDTTGSKLDRLKGKTLWAGPQSADQEWTRGNKALKISCVTKKPVRVIRGYGLDSRYAPSEGYRYDGLYQVVKAWRAPGKTGFKTCRFTFQRLPGQPPLPGTLLKASAGKARTEPNLGERPPPTFRQQPGSSPKVTLDIKRTGSPVVTGSRSQHVTEAGPSKTSTVNHAHPMQKHAPVGRQVAPLPMVRVKPNAAALPPFASPSATPRTPSSLKRLRDESRHKDNLKPKLRKVERSTSSVEHQDMERQKWAAIAGTKRYANLRFVKKTED